MIMTIGSNCGICKPNGNQICNDHLLEAKRRAANNNISFDEAVSQMHVEAREDEAEAAAS